MCALASHSGARHQTPGISSSRQKAPHRTSGGGESFESLSQMIHCACFVAISQTELRDCLGCGRILWISNDISIDQEHGVRLPTSPLKELSKKRSAALVERSEILCETTSSRTNSASNMSSQPSAGFLTATLAEPELGKESSCETQNAIKRLTILLYDKNLRGRPQKLSVVNSLFTAPRFVRCENSSKAGFILSGFLSARHGKLPKMLNCTIVH
jgi:hypothetical protein